MKTTGHGKFFIKLLAAALTVLLLTAFAGVSASAAVNSDGLTVEKLSFRDVLRLYALDKGSFGADALATDENGVTNAAKRLAELFGYTVGLNYDGVGSGSNYFGKDITALMGQEPYTDETLLATYDVEISPCRSYASPLPQGQTVALRVYLAGYANAANGVEPVLHYVWQDHDVWYAVKDNNPYYRVSYNGESARQLSGTGFSITYTRSADRGTETLQSWQDLTEAPDGDGVVHLDCSTLVVGQGNANVFGLTRDLSRLQREGNYSSSLLAVSDFVRGDATYKTGPLVFSRSVYEADSMRRVTDGESLKEGVRYRFRVVYDEALAVAPDAAWSSVGMSIRSEVTGETKPVSDFTWYGDEAYLTSNKYNPHTVEFTFTPSTQGYSVCTFTPVNLVGSDTSLKAADFHARTETGTAAVPVTVAAPAPSSPPSQAAQAPAAAPVQASVPAPTPAPVQASLQASGSGAVQAPAEEAPAATPAPAAPTAAPSTPQAVPPTPAAPSTPVATLGVLFSASDSAPLTQGVLAETLWILAGRPGTDVNISLIEQITDPNMYTALIWATRTGLLSSESGSLGTDEPLTREETAAILYRYAAARGRDVSIRSDLSAWSDGILVNARNTSAMIWALEREMIGSCPDGTLRPTQTATCGEAIVMIRTFQQKL